MGLLDRARGELHDAFVVPGAGALGVLLGRQAEDQDGRDAELAGVACLGDGMGDREPVDPGHRRDRLAAVDPVRDEHRIDEVRRVQARLANQAPQSTGAAQSAQAGLRKSHCRSEHSGGLSQVSRRVLTN